MSADRPAPIHRSGLANIRRDWSERVRALGQRPHHLGVGEHQLLVVGPLPAEHDRQEHLDEQDQAQQRQPPGSAAPASAP